MRAELVYIQYNISDSEALFWYFIFISLRTASLDTLSSYVLWDSKPGFVLDLFFLFFFQNQDFWFYEFVLIKKRIYIILSLFSLVRVYGILFKFPKSSFACIICGWTWVREDTSTQATSAFIKCKHWMYPKVSIVKTSGAISHMWPVS